MADFLNGIGDIIAGFAGNCFAIIALSIGHVFSIISFQILRTGRKCVKLAGKMFLKMTDVSQKKLSPRKTRITFHEF